MDDNKTEKYTFGADEKNTLEILALFEQELDERLQESESESQKVKYYEEFKMNDIDFKNIFVTTEKDAEGNETYHVYCGDSSNEILSIDSNGNVDVKNPELALFLGEVDLDKIIEENEKEPGKLKGISEKAEPEELQRAIEKEDEHGEKIRERNEDIEAEKEEEQQENEQEDKDEDTLEVENDLEQQGENLRISSYRKIKDSKIAERMPEVFKNGEENGIAYSKTLNRYVIISKINGQYQLNEKIEPAKMTWKTITSISPDGSQVERRVPHALMKIPSNDKKEIAVSLDQYGDVDIETVDVLSCQERIARSVREEGEGLEGEENREVTRGFETEGIQYQHEIAHTKEQLEREYKVTETHIEELKDLDIEAIMEREAQKAKISKESFKEYVRKADGKTLKDKIDNAHEEIEQEYMGNQRPR